jgi:NAD(P)-dependent dehydrogenase (short-subunit alcohol dehydrogenase family)
MSKTVLITGSSTGFGRDTAETLARRRPHGVRVDAQSASAEPRPCASATKYVTWVAMSAQSRMQTDECSFNLF